MTFPCKQALLSDLNVWIGDTGGAMQHMTAFKNGMTNICKTGNEDKVTMGNGHVKMTTEIGDMPGVVCNRNGCKVTSTILKDVAIIPPSSGYNLFSLTKLMKTGWIFSGKDNKLT
jgi:hypothetical protein